MNTHWLFGITLASCLLAGAHAQEVPATPSPKEVAGQCRVSFIETPHLKLKEYFKNDSMLTSSCDIRFKSQGDVVIGELGLLFYPRNKNLDDEVSLGFSRVPGQPGQWRFEGTKEILSEGLIIERSFTQEKTGEEVLLVGHQLQRGTMPSGGITELPGIRILRLTPQFAISVDLNFEPMTTGLSVKAYKQRLETTSQELVEIVKGLQPTPGQAGPTVRLP